MTIPPQPTTVVPNSATRVERALVRQRFLHPDESCRRELGVRIGAPRRHLLRFTSRGLGGVITGKSS